MDLYNSIYLLYIYKWFYSTIHHCHLNHLGLHSLAFCLGTAMIEPPFLWRIFQFTLAINPIVWEAIGHPKKMPWICATCSSLLWRPHREWFNGGCPALSAQGFLTIRLPLASLSVSLAESWQIFDIFDAGGGQGVHTKTQGNWYILIILIYVVIMTMCSTFSLAESGENVGWRNLFI